MCSSLGYPGRRCGAESTVLNGDGGSGRRTSPACVAGVPGIRHERGYLAQKEQPGLEFSPRFETGEGATQDEPAASSGGGAGRRSRSGVRDASPSLGSPTNQSAATLWKCCGVRKVANHAGGVEFQWRVNLPAAVPGPNPAASGVVAEDGGRWEFPGTRVKPRRWFAGCMARWCGVTTAAQGAS